MYLSQQFTTLDGIAYRMAGVLHFAMEMTGKLVKFGYVTVKLTGDCLLGRRGTTVRGHSFHYSRIAATIFPRLTIASSIRFRASMRMRVTAGNVLASYIHLHFRTAPVVALHLIETAVAPNQAGTR